MSAAGFDAARIYACDKRAAEICTRMQQVGFAFDAQRAVVLSAHLRELEAAARVAAEDAIGRKLAPTKTGGIKAQDLEDAFFRDLKAPVFFRSALTGAPSLGVDSLRAYAASAVPALRALSLAELDRRRARKIRSTYVDSAPVNPDTFRVHPGWQNYGAVSGRWSCSAPNLQNLPRKDNDPTFGTFTGGVRGLYCAPLGRCLVTLDYKQLEVKMAAYATGDEAMIARATREDVHCANAEMLFGEAFSVLNGEAPEDAVAFKQFRTLAKNAIFAINYGASAETVYFNTLKSGIEAKMRQIEMMLKKLRRGCRVYFTIQDSWLSDAVRTGFVYTPILQRRRWVGHDPTPPECYNFPIQGGAADLMNSRMPRFEDLLDNLLPSARIVAQVHDSVVTECFERDATRVSELAREVFEAPITIESSGRPIEASFTIDLEVTERWS